jgi:hypothetical protein
MFPRWSLDCAKYYGIFIFVNRNLVFPVISVKEKKYNFGSDRVIIAILKRENPCQRHASSNQFNGVVFSDALLVDFCSNIPVFIRQGFFVSFFYYCTCFLLFSEQKLAYIDDYTDKDFRNKRLLADGCTV